MLIKCPECGRQVSSQAPSCPGCGIPIAGKITRCPDCGEIIFKEQAECPNCHCSINREAVPEVTELNSRRQGQEAVAEEPSKSASENSPQPPVKKKRKIGYTILVVAVVIALIIVFLGFYFYKTQEQENEQRAYENALKSDLPVVLQNFLDMYEMAPQAHRDSIIAHLEILNQIEQDWAHAVVSGSKAELEKFMKLHPNNVHNTEALIKIDSIDWVAAMTEDTPEAYKSYINAHFDGAHYDEAQLAFERADAQLLKPEDKRMVSELFARYFMALSQRDEIQLTETLENVLTSFLHKEQATKTDVMQYMHRLYEDDITKIIFSLNNDWKIEKSEVEEGRYAFTVDFSFDQRMERTDLSKERFCTYKVQAKVSPDCKISELNMKKMVQKTLP